jgi:hypothetical protein
MLNANALTTVAAAEDELNVPAGQDTARLERYIQTASEVIERWLNRGALHFAAGIVEVGRPYVARQRMALSRTPVVAVASVLEAGTPLLSPADWSLLWPGAGILERAAGRLWLADVEVSVTYSAGWVTPAQAALEPALTRTLPLDIEHAALLTVGALWRARGEDPSISSETVGDVSFSYRGRNTAIGVNLAGIIPDAAALLLSPYRRRPLR